MAPLFCGEEVVKEFPESEVLPLLGSWLLFRPPLGLPFSGPRDLAELICVEGGEEVSLPESYSWERPREVVSGLAVLVKRSTADPDPVITPLADRKLSIWRGWLGGGLDRASGLALQRVLEQRRECLRRDFRPSSGDRPRCLLSQLEERDSELWDREGQWWWRRR